MIWPTAPSAPTSKPADVGPYFFLPFTARFFLRREAERFANLFTLFFLVRTFLASARWVFERVFTLRFVRGMDRSHLRMNGTLRMVIDFDLNGGNVMPLTTFRMHSPVGVSSNSPFSVALSTLPAPAMSSVMRASPGMP